MLEIIDLSKKILFMPLPLPISFGGVRYYNLFSFGVVVFIIWVVAFIIEKLTTTSTTSTTKSS